MDAIRWTRVESLFHDARSVAAADRRAFLESRSADDPTIVLEVLSLLEADANASPLLDADLPQVAHSALNDTTPAARTIGAYRVGRLLGEGGMGIVYLAERPDLGTRAAIKFLRDAWASPARRERFATEQRTLAQLNHRGIARLFDADTLPDGTPWIVMEYVEGLPLTAHCRDHAIGIADRLRLFRAVCEAVQYAHGHAVIHRDLKPSNILVTPEGEVKLLDFGIAKHLEGPDAPAEQTRTSNRLLTPAYAAPEQHRGEQVGIYTDVYALGVILYELLTERLPFDLSDRTPADAERIVTQEPPVRPSSVVPASLRKGAWGDLDVLCLTAMHKDPQRRYRSVEALIRDVDHYLGGEPLDARPDTLGYRVGKFVRRNAREVAAASALFATVVALVVFYTLRLAAARDDARAESLRTQRIQQFTMNLFRGGTDEGSPADSLRVRTLVERGVQEARALDADPALQADLYETLGAIYRRLGDFRRADTLLRASLVSRQARLGGDHPAVASSLVALGLLRDDEAEFDEAQRLVREGLGMATRTLPPGDVQIARATAALGQVLNNRGLYDSAIVMLGEAVRLHSAGGALTPELVSAMSELANAHFYAGHYATADSINLGLVALDRRLYGEDHPRVADDLLNLGATRLESQDYAAAERYYREAWGIMRRWYGDDHPETASSITMVARALVSQDKPDEATVLLRQALATYERVYGPVHPRVASALNDLGRIARSQHRLDDAERDFRRVVDIYRQVYHDKHYFIGVALSNLAGIHHERGEYREAERIFRDVLRRYAEVLEPEHNLVGIAHVRLGHTLAAEHEYAQAESELTTGLAILMKQPTPPASWVESAKKDLALVKRGRS